MVMGKPCRLVSIIDIVGVVGHRGLHDTDVDDVACSVVEGDIVEAI